MKFLYPTFLLALLTVAVPIIIHLFSFKRHKTVYFSNVGFLKNIKKESQKKSRLKQLLVLAARILTLIFLVLAFAQPFIPSKQNTQTHPRQLVGIYIDNSFSMNALSEQGQLLETARKKALEICMAYPVGTKFRLFTNDLLLKHNHEFNKEQLIQEVSEIKPSPAAVSLSLVYNRFAQKQTEQDAEVGKSLYLISDFQRSTTDIENMTGTDIAAYYMPLRPNEVANLYIDSCWVEVPAHRLGQEENMFVRIKNSSNTDYQNLPLKLFINDSLKSITNYSVEARKEIVAQLKYTNHTSGVQHGKIEISDYPFIHDNNWYISYKVEKQLKALAIFASEPESQQGLNYMKSLFDNDDYVVLDQMNVQSLKVNQLQNYNTIFLLNLEDYPSGFMNALEKAMNNGVSVAVFPGLKNPTASNQLLARWQANTVSGTDSTRQKISGIEFENRFYQDVFKKKAKNPELPEIDKHLRFQTSIRSAENILLRFQNGDKALSMKEHGAGKAWIFSFPLNQKNESFARHVLFVPTLYNIVLNSLPQQQLAYVVGLHTFVDLPRNLNINLNSTLEIEQQKTGERFAPAKNNSDRGTRIETDAIANDGHYSILNDDKNIATLAYNFNRLESDLFYFDNGELQRKIDAAGQKNAALVEDAQRAFSEIFDELQHGKQLWKLCVLLALLFIIAEVLIVRFMRG